MQSPKALTGSLLIVYLICGCGSLLAQGVPSSLTPGAKQPTTSMLPKAQKKHKSAFFSPRKSNSAFKKGRVKHSARYEFYERVEKAAKEKQKLMRKLAKSQYSDPSYFGHKKKPKRRPPHKMRFCDECHIRH